MRQSHPEPIAALQLRALRESRGLTLRELARRADLNPSQLSLIERGMRDAQFSTIDRIVRELGQVLVTKTLRNGHAS